MDIRRVSSDDPVTGVLPLLVRFAVMLSMFFALSTGDGALAQIKEEVFLPDTDHELRVYRIRGDEPGKTIMIIGGIQGDEPGGYLTADLYADIHLERGNLIVVPRANFYSILLNRRNGETGDMNRKFNLDVSDSDKRSLEDEIVTILKHLIAESDCLLNLHEGSGFYAPTWIDNMENPMRYGQSIIYDADTYRIPATNRILYLGELAKRVICRVNSRIDNERYHFRPNNHRTMTDDSLHKEQRHSATYYALAKAHIPAFGVETSKSIDSLEQTIRMHRMVINAFMNEFGIVQESPGVSTKPPRLDYLLLKVNNGHPYALPSGFVLKLNPGDEVVITDIIANYRRGLAADVPGLGTNNDMNWPFRFTEPVKILVRKDAEKCGWVKLENRDSRETGVTPFRKKQGEISENELRAEKVLIDVDGETLSIKEQEILTVVKGSRLTLKGIKTNIPVLDNRVKLNFKGFAPPKAYNDGQDLHFSIYTDQDLWVRYSRNGKGRFYPIIATYKGEKVGEFWVELDSDDDAAEKQSR
ncbi:MAG: M14/M99 family metallopeptidase [Thermodesulfobacteriota bacterium]